MVVGLGNKEGEGDRSLTWWQDSHRKIFTQWFKDAALTFKEDGLIVLEEFRCVYPHLTNKSKNAIMD